jgi:hypothetical protein
MHRNGSSSIAACIFVAARMYLATRCLAMRHNTNDKTALQKFLSVIHYIPEIRV